MQESTDADRVQFLVRSGADRISHSGTTLLGHLVAVQRILRGWGAPKDVATAGLFHSVYGTEFFRQPPLATSERGRVRALIGERAERLAWIFCAFDRNAFLRACDAGTARPPSHAIAVHGGAEIALEAGEAEGLVLLLLANALEQDRRADGRAIVHPILRMPGVAEFLPPSLHDELLGRGWLGRLFGDEADRVRRSEEEAAPTHLLVHGSPERLGSLAACTLAQLSRCPRTSTRAALRRVDGKIASVVPRRDQVVQFHNYGASINMFEVDSEDVATCQRSLEEELGLLRQAVRLGVSASRTGFGGPRYDCHENIMVQIAGTRTWRVAPSEGALPTLMYVAGQPLTPALRAQGRTSVPADLQEIELRPGSALWLPRGTWHEIAAVTQAPSLHLNLRLRRPSWRDVLLFHLEERGALEGIATLRPSAAVDDESALRAHVASALTEVVELANGAMPALSAVELGRWWRRRP
jgi:hypothetical protein